ncbi:MAG: hypothetical protein Q9199_002886 [Rusavskia elegans]
MIDGNYDYLELVEDEIGWFYGAEQGLMVGSGFEANPAIFTAIRSPGDAIVYDELVHATIVLGNSTIKNALTNFENIQRLVKHFFIIIATDAIWEQTTAQGVFSVPLSSDWGDMPALTHIIPISTRQRYSYWLIFHLYMRKFSTVLVEFPVVPKGQGRVRLVSHTNNNESQVESLVSAIGEWAQEMMEIEKDQGTRGTKLPRAARQVYAWKGNRAVDGSESVEVLRKGLADGPYGIIGVGHA